jgi:hypothetical protein
VAALSAFNGPAPNGVWSLYVMDDTSGDQGRFANGWSLNITTTSTAPAALLPASPSTVGAALREVSELRPIVKSPPPSSQPVSLKSVERLASGQTRIRVEAPPGISYRIQVSSDLLRWADLCSGKATGGVLECIDLNLNQSDSRFYRVNTIDE